MSAVVGRGHRESRVRLEELLHLEFGPASIDGSDPHRVPRTMAIEPTAEERVGSWADELFVCQQLLHTSHRDTVPLESLANLGSQPDARGE